MRNSLVFGVLVASITSVGAITNTMQVRVQSAIYPNTLCTINFNNPSTTTDTSVIYRNVIGLSAMATELHFYPDAYCPFRIKRIAIQRVAFQINSFTQDDRYPWKARNRGSSTYFNLPISGISLNDSYLEVSDTSILEFYKVFTNQLNILALDTFIIELTAKPTPPTSTYFEINEANVHTANQTRLFDINETILFSLNGQYISQSKPFSNIIIKTNSHASLRISKTLNNGLRQ